MNTLVLFSYGSLRTIDDIAYFYDDIFHGHATEADITAAVTTYKQFGKADPLGANTSRIGRALCKQLEQKTGETWQMFIANHHAKPSIQTIAETCSEINPNQIVTLSLTPFDSLTGNRAYVKEFQKHLLKNNDTISLTHVTPFCDNDLFVQALTDRVQTAQNWLSASVRNEAEIVFTMHSMPGVPEAHQHMLEQYEILTNKIATAVNIKDYHMAYRSGHPDQRWLEPDVLDVIPKLKERNVPAIIFVETLSVIENMEVIQEITEDAIHLATKLGIEAVQSEYLNDSIDFIEALADHVWTEYVQAKME